MNEGTDFSFFSFVLYRSVGLFYSTGDWTQSLMAKTLPLNYIPNPAFASPLQPIYLSGFSYEYPREFNKRMHFPSHVIFLLFLSSLAASVINCVQRGVGKPAQISKHFVE